MWGPDLRSGQAVGPTVIIDLMPCFHQNNASAVEIKWRMAKVGPNLYGTSTTMVAHGSLLGSMDQILDQVGQVVPLLPNVILHICPVLDFCMYSH